MGSRKNILARSLFDRYGREHTSQTWDDLVTEDRAYWKREAAVVRRAVVREEKLGED